MYTTAAHVGENFDNDFNHTVHTRITETIRGR